MCRAYRCAWLAGAFGDADRPDRLGALLDFVTRGDAVHLVVRQADGDAPQLASRLQQIVADTRRSMPVEIRDVEDVLDADRAYRVLHPGGAEHRIEGDRLQIMEGGRVVAERRAPWLERCVRSLVEHVRARRLRRWPSHAERLARLGLPAREEPD